MLPFAEKQAAELPQSLHVALLLPTLPLLYMITDQSSKFIGNTSIKGVCSN